eukprot:1023474-Rhodomonas_salina.2
MVLPRAKHLISFKDYKGSIDLTASDLAGHKYFLVDLLTALTTQRPEVVSLNLSSNELGDEAFKVAEPSWRPLGCRVLTKKAMRLPGSHQPSSAFSQPDEPELCVQPAQRRCCCLYRTAPLGTPSHFVPA